MKKTDFSDLDGRGLQLFLAVYEEGAVTRAATRLSVTQSAVSHGLERLRGILGDPLFVRSGRGIVPTPRAEALVEPARRLLTSMKAMAEMAEFDPAEAQGSFTISTNDNERETLLPPVFHRLNRIAPGLTLNVVPNRLDLHETLRSGAVDLGITPLVPDGADFMQQALYEDRMAVFYDASVRAAPVDPQSYLAARHALVSFAAHMTHPVDEALATRGLSRQIVLKVPGIAAAGGLLRGSDVVLTLPRRIGGSLLRGLSVCDCPVAVAPLSFRQVWHRRNHTAGLHRWIRRLVHDATRARAAPRATAAE